MTAPVEYKATEAVRWGIDRSSRFSVDTRCSGSWQKARARRQRFVSSNHQDSTGSQTLADASKHVALHGLAEIRKRNIPAENQIELA